LESGKTAVQISNILGISKTIAYRHVKNLLRSGLVDNNNIKYIQAKPPEEQKWYRVIERTAEELPFPTARKMYYRLIELADIKVKHLD
jgi:predicted transcriptional regulator